MNCLKVHKYLVQQWTKNFRFWIIFLLSPNLFFLIQELIIPRHLALDLLDHQNKRNPAGYESIWWTSVKLFPEFHSCSFGKETTQEMHTPDEFLEVKWTIRKPNMRTYSKNSKMCWSCSIKEECDDDPWRRDQAALQQARLWYYKLLHYFSTTYMLVSDNDNTTS